MTFGKADSIRDDQVIITTPKKKPEVHSSPVLSQHLLNLEKSLTHSPQNLQDAYADEDEDGEVVLVTNPVGASTTKSSTGTGEDETMEDM